ncbi:unnamed protein product [Gongylonema pulchrum]|uniref:Zgc: n=1 Tax=Gongylonema pulchrum TaxID=637853 RepID=A0A183DG84_9BILA|nr:unnamed protein product [Gongylonema pulchrum]
MAGPAYIPRGPRPSVLSINTNNRGMVKQRVNLFAQLGTQASFTENQVIKTAHHRQDGERVSYSGQKPSAPPASHGLQVKTPDSASLLNKQRAAVRVKKFEGRKHSCDLYSLHSIHKTIARIHVLTRKLHY